MADIHGLHRAVSKQVDLTIAEYNGLARDGELIVDTNPGVGQYRVYVGTSTGNVMPVTSSNANYANYAGNVVNSAQPNITSVGTLTDLSVAGNTVTGNLQVTGVVNGSLMPGANITYDLGSTTQRWKDLWISNSTIHLGDTQLSTVGGNLLFNGKNVLTQQSGSNIVLLGSNSDVKITGGTSGQVLTTDGTGNLSWTTASGNGGGNSSEITNTDGFNTYSVNVGNTGVVSMNTARGGLEFGAMPEIGGPTHLHIMRPAGQEGSTDLYFGDDYNYVKMPGLYGPGTQGVEIGSSYNSGPVSTWRFDTNGNLTFPDGTTQSTAYVSANVVTSYKGFSAHYGRMYNSEPTLSKIAIYKDTVTPSSSIDTSTEDDFFQVTGLTGSDIVALFVIMGSDSNNPTDLPTLQSFTETVVDNVLLNGGVEGNFNNIDDMRSAFYSNYSTIAANAGGLYSNFQFFKNTFNNFGSSTGNTVEGSGAAFSIVSPGAGFAYVDPPTVWLGSEGTNYQVGHKIKILGTDLGGITPDNDAIITVTQIGAGGSIVTATISGTGGDVGGGTYNNVTGTNYQVGSGFVISGVLRNADGSIQNTGVNAWGGNYVVGDVIILPGSIFEDCTSPANDIIMTVTSIGGSGEPYGFNLSGTLPNDIWPPNYIQDGGNDQYDGGNYISTDLATDIPYNSGNVVSGSDSEFGTGSSYVVVYQDSIWGILATGAGVNSIKTDGGSGFDGDGAADTGALFGGGGGVDIGDFVFNGRTMTVTGSNEDLTIQAPDDLFLDAKDDDIFIRANDDIRLRTAYNFTTDSYQWEFRFNSEGVQTLYNSSEGNDYGFIRPINDSGTTGISLESSGNTYIKSSYGGSSWMFDNTGKLNLAGGNSTVQSIANSSLDPVNPNVSTLVLTPDQNYNSQALVLDPTAPGHIHLRAPSGTGNIDNPSANLFLGGEASSFEIGASYGDLPNVYVHSNNKTWTFGSDGNLTTPGLTGTYIKSAPGGYMGLAAMNDGGDQPAQLVSIDSNSGIGTTAISVYANNAQIQANINGDIKTWVFDNTGNLTLPGNTFAVNYANGTQVSLGGGGGSYGDSNVATLLSSFGSNNISTTGNVTANNFSGNITITGNVTGTSPNVSLVAGSYTMTFDNTGILTLPTMGGDEGGEINLGVPVSNTTLLNSVKVDVYQNKFRIFDGSTKGAYIDLSQTATGVGTLLNNRVSGFVDAGIFVTMDNIRATVTTSGQRGLSLATVTGSFTYNIGGTFAGAAVGSSGTSLAGQTLTTTPTASIFGWGLTAAGDIAVYHITNTSSLLTYRITVQIGGSFLNNMISIERLI